MENENVKETKKPNRWLSHVASVRAKNPGVIYKDVLQLAKETYHKDEKPEKIKIRKTPVKVLKEKRRKSK